MSPEPVKPHDGDRGRGREVSEGAGSRPWPLVAFVKSRPYARLLRGWNRQRQIVWLGHVRGQEERNEFAEGICR